MYEIEVHADFDADPERVFGRISDHATFLTAGPVVTRVIVPGSPSPNGLGAVREVRSEPVVFREEILAFDPPHRYDYRIVAISGPLGLPLPVRHERGWMTVEPSGGGSHVAWRSRFSVPLPLLGGPIERTLGGQFSSTFRDLLRRAARSL